MANEFRMPSLGADMEAGTVIEWRVRPGDAVHRGDVVLEVETEKGLIEVEIWEDGIVEAILVEPGQEVPVGTVLALIQAEQAAARASTVPSPAATQPSAAPAPKLSPEPSPEPVGSTGASAMPDRQRVSPRARRRATELGVDLTRIHGTGEGGAITEADVEGATRQRVLGAAPTVALTADQRAAMRRAIGAAMSRSKRDIPHYYLDSQIDMSRASHWLTEQNLARPVTTRLLAAALLIKAVALAAREVPEMNGFYRDDAFLPGSGVHVGMAISLRGGGLVAPAIHDADRLSLDAVMDAFRDMVQRARAGSLRSSEISDATITVSSLGENSADTVFGVIYPPQVALVGFGTIAERPWADGGSVHARPTVTASLAADHRVSDGHRGARFLSVIKRLLQAPEQL